MKNSRILRIFIVPALSLAISIATIEVCTSIAKNKIIRMADEVAVLNKRYASLAIEQDMIATSWTDFGFASSFAAVDSSHIFRFLDTQYGRLTSDQVYERIQSFLSVHPDYHAVSVILEKGVLADRKGRRFAGCVRGEEPDVRVDLLDGHDIFGHEQYRRGADSLSRHYYSSVRAISVDSSVVYIHTIPMYDGSDRLVGQLWLDYDLLAFGDQLSSVQQYRNSTILLVDEVTDQIAASSVRNLAGMPFLAAVDSLFGNSISPEETGLITAAMATDKDITFQAMKGRNRSKVYVSEFRDYDLSFVQIVPEAQTYASINRFKYVLLGLSILGILFVFLLSAIFFRKFYKSESENISNQREMTIASQLQDHLLPPSLPRVPGWEVDAVQRQALLVGGDLYDCRVRRGKMMLCVGDVSGKGVPACMYMGMVGSHLRASFQSSSDPAKILSGINDAICDRNVSMMFCTMFLAVLDIETGVLEFCNAGHDRPVLKTAEGWSFLEMKKNVPLGIEPGFKFVSETLTLAPSDALYVYTDGVTEARSASERLYGEGRLLDLLQSLRPENPESPAAVNSAVLSDIEKFSAGAPQSDDITMLCVRRP